MGCTHAARGAVSMDAFGGDGTQGCYVVAATVRALEI